jgi:enoyl-CoA hydratase/carnithine racemase
VHRLKEEAKKVALRMARLPAIAVKQNKEAINRAYDMRGLVATLEYGQADSSAAQAAC